MALIDIGILIILALFLLKGVLRGLLKEVCSLLGLVLGGVFAYSLHVPLAQHLQDSFDLPAQVCVWGAFLAIYLLVVIVFAVIGFVLHRFVKLVFLGGFNRLAGALFGVVQGVVLLAVVLLALNSSMAPKAARRMVHEAQLAPPFATLGQTLFDGSRKYLGR